jgi:hypothetical protein
VGPRAEDFRTFGAVVAGNDSPLYGHVCEAIAGSPELLELAAGSSEPMPNLFLAAIHAELLRSPDEELAAYYPTAGGRRALDDALGPALMRFCDARREPIEAMLATRHTQTNETARCSALLPAFAAVADERPLAQIEIGASAGLNGLWDHYAYDYGGRAAGDPGSPLRIECELVGTGVPPLEPPAVAWRAGIDRSPVDLRDEADVRWLRACIWPDQSARHARLAAALQVAHEHGPVEVHRGDALALLPGVIESAPADALVCVFHTAALVYFGAEKVAELRTMLEERDVVWLGGEASGVLVGDPGRVGPTLHFALTAGRGGKLEQIGRMGHHGGWLEWF